MTENFIFFGKIVALTEKYAILKPILCSDPTGNQWDNDFTEDLRQNMLPDKGEVIWFRPPSTVSRDSYWEFEVEEQPDYHKKSIHTEKFHVKIHPEPVFREALEIVDLRNAGSEREIREGLTSREGFPLDSAPSMKKVMLWLQDDLWLGPVTLRHCTDSRWTIEGLNGGDEPCTILDAYNPEDTEIWHIPHNGNRFNIPPPGQKLGRRIGIRNWEPDEMVAKRVLKKIGKLDSTMLDSIKVTKKLFDTYINLLSIKETGILSTELEHELAGAERIKEMKDLLERNTPIVEEAVCLFTSSQHFVKRISEIESDTKKKATEEANNKVDEDLKGKKNEVEKLKKSLETKKTELQLIEKKLKKQKDEMDRKITGYEKEFSARLSEMASNPQAVFPELAAFSYALGGNPLSDRQNIALPDNFLGKDAPEPTTISEISDKSILLKSARKAYHQNGFSFHLANRMLASFISGLVPVIAGDKGFLALEIFSRLVAGGRLIWIPVSGSFFEPQDLFGATDRNGRFIPHPTGLLDAIQEAYESPEKLSIVVLDGFNRSPIDAYLLPILQSKLDQHKSRPLPIHSCFFAGSNGNTIKSVRLLWPRNLLLALLPLREGSFSPTSQFWEHAALIDTGLGPHVETGSDLNIIHPDSEPIPAEITEVSGSVWNDFNVDAKTKPLNEIGEWFSILNNELIDGAGAETIRMLSACLTSEMDEYEAKSQTVFSSVLPKLSHDKTDFAELLSKCDITMDKETERVISTIAKIGV